MRPSGKRNTGQDFGPSRDHDPEAVAAMRPWKVGREGDLRAGFRSARTNRRFRAKARESNGNPERAIRLTRGLSLLVVGGRWSVKSLFYIHN